MRLDGVATLNGRRVSLAWVGGSLKVNKPIMLNQIARILVVVGSINWGLVGLGMLMGSDWNVVHMILGSVPMLEAIVYVLVGLAAVKMVWPR